MWVSSLEFSNIKSFAASEGPIHLDRRMNILMGANNSGKSTILRVLYLLQNQGSLTASDVRIGGNATGYIKLEDIDNDHIYRFTSAGQLPAIQLTGNRGGALQLTAEINGTRQSFLGVIPAREPDNLSILICQRGRYKAIGARYKSSLSLMWPTP